MRLQKQIESITGQTLTAPDKKAVLQVISLLGKGELRVASRDATGWQTHAWIKQAILFYFRISKMTEIKAGAFSWADKIPVRKFGKKDGVRTVPPAFVRVGAHVAPGAILMPSYVNIGAYVGKNTMIDTWATVGSCAQVGENVHVSGGVGVGGVLEPLQASPVIIEDDVFVGSRCIVVEGVLVEKGAVLGAGVVLTQSTKIIDVTGQVEKTYRGRVPSGSIVIPGTKPKIFPSGTYDTPCALIIGSRNAKTDTKTSLNQALRDFEISV